MAKGEVRYRLILDSKDFTSGVKAAEKEFQGLLTQLSGGAGALGGIASAMGPAGMAVAAAMGAATVAVGAFAKASIDGAVAAVGFAGNVSDLSTKTGIASTSLQILGQAGLAVGVTMEEAATAIMKMQQQMVKAPEDFKQLGLAVSDLQKLAPEKQFEAIGQAIQKIQDPAQRTAATIHFFGKSGQEAMKLLSVSMDDAAKQAERLGLIMDDSTREALDAVGDSAALLAEVWDHLWMNIGGAVAASPAVREALDAITEELGNLSRFVQENDEEIQDLVRAAIIPMTTALTALLKGVQFMVSAFLQWKHAIADVKDALRGGWIEAAIKALGGSLGGGPKPMATGWVDVKPPKPPKGIVWTDPSALAKAARDEEAAIKAHLKSLSAGMEAFFGELESRSQARANLLGLLGPSVQDATTEMGRLASATEKLGGVMELSDSQLIKLIDSMRAQIALGGENAEGFRIWAAAMQEAANRGDAVAKAAGFVTKEFQVLPTALDKARQAAIEAERAFIAMWEGVSEGADQFSSILGDLDGFLDDLGVSADSTGRRLVQMFAQAAQGAATFAAGMASGNPAAMVSGVLQMGSALVGFLGASSRAREEAMRLANEIRNMRNEFIESHGGIERLRQAAEEAGVDLRALFSADTVEEFRAAMESVQQQFEDFERELQLIEEGTQQTLDALERWNIPIEATSTAFQQARLHEGLAEIYRDIQLLLTAGVDLETILGSDLGAALIDFVQQAMAAGAALPEFMRPYIQALIDAGLLLDANGDKITDISQLTFTETLEAGVSRLIDEIRELIRVLSGIPAEVNTKINVITEHQLNPGQNPHNVNPHDNLTGGGHPPQDDPIQAAEGFYSPALPADAFFQLHKGERVEVTPADETPMRNMRDAGGDTQVVVYIGGERLDGVIQRRIDAGLIRVSA